MSDAPLSRLDKIILLCATLGPVGHLPKAPGTWASAAALLLAPWLFLPLPLWYRIGVCALLLATGALIAQRAVRLLGAADPGCVVVDELVGQWVAFLPFHQPPWGPTMPWELLLLFALFRFFDILKPWPIRRIETLLPGGLGVMADDVAAGLYAAGAFALIRLGIGYF